MKAMTLAITQETMENAVYWMTEAGRLAKWDHGGEEGERIRSLLRTGAVAAAEAMEAPGVVDIRMDKVWQEQDAAHTNLDNIPEDGMAIMKGIRGMEAALFKAMTRAEDKTAWEAILNAGKYTLNYWTEYSKTIPVFMPSQG